MFNAKKTILRAAGCLLTSILCLPVHSQPKLVQTVRRQPGVVSIPFQKYVLSNGLTVILTEDHSDPLVHVDITYHVGSAREMIGKSGFAHFFEHMMFEGSDHVKSGQHMKTVYQSGGTLNGTTNQDRTNYFETVPNNQLQKMLWLESDRMGFLLDAVTEKKFENQRSTVKNERGQNYDNKPYGLSGETLAKALYPYGHPYSWLPIGNVEDLNRSNLNDLKNFFLRWYSPNNATLTIGGDIDPKSTLQWVQRYFGTIPRGPEVKKMQLPAPDLNEDRYVSYKDNYARQPILLVSYPGVKTYERDMAALDAMAMIIGQGRSSILYKNFVQSKKAIQASMSSLNMELAGQLTIQVMPYAGHALSDVKKSIDESLAEFEKRGVTDEDLQRFKTSSKLSYINSLTSVNGKVSTLAIAQTYTGNPDQIGKELEAINAVTKEDVMRVYAKYIKNKHAVVLSVLPKEGDSLPAGADNYTVVQTGYTPPDYGYDKLSYNKPKDHFDRSVQPPASANPVVKVPSFWKSVTSNGVRLIGTVNNETPTVAILLSVKGGGLMAAKDPAKAGLPSLVAQMLNDDTQNYSAEQFSTELQKLGSSVQVTASAEETTFILQSMTENLDKTLNLFQERLFRPKFTQEALNRIKKQNLQALQNMKTQASALASSVFNKVLYGKDNIETYGLNGTEETLRNISLADIQAYYDQYFAPGITSVIIVGDINEKTAKSKLSFLDKWQAKTIQVPKGSTTGENIPPNTVFLVDVPKAAQSEIRIGCWNLLNYDPLGTYYKTVIANYPLGGAFSSRLNLELREEKGWTYGVNSSFSSGKSGGVFSASTGVRSTVTDSALAACMHIMGEYARDGETPDELNFTKQSIGQSDALRFETNSMKARFLSRLQDYNLNADYVNKQSRMLSSMSLQEVNQIIKEYLNPEKMAIVIVGDKERIMPGLLKLGYQVVELDADGNRR